MKNFKRYIIFICEDKDWEWSVFENFELWIKIL